MPNAATNSRVRSLIDRQVGPGASSTSLYPNCLTVTMALASIGNFSRNRRICTSTVRVPPV